jgi:hypothetical protein
MDWIINKKWPPKAIWQIIGYWDGVIMGAFN